MKKLNDKAELDRDIAAMLKAAKDECFYEPYIYHGPYFIDGKKEICRVEVGVNGEIISVAIR